MAEHLSQNDTVLVFHVFYELWPYLLQKTGSYVIFTCSLLLQSTWFRCHTCVTLITFREIICVTLSSLQAIFHSTGNHLPHIFSLTAYFLRRTSR